MPIFSILPRFWSSNAIPRQEPINLLAANRSQLPDFVQQCPVALHYLDLLGPLPWQTFPEPFKPRTWLHADCLPKSAFIAACFIRLDQRMRYTSQLVSYLGQHPALLLPLLQQLAEMKLHMHSVLL